MFKNAVVAITALFALSLPAAAQEPTNRSRAEALISDASWSESDVTEYIYLVTTQTGRAVLLPATTQGRECERQVAALDDLRLRLQAHPQIIEQLTEERLAAMRVQAVQVGACNGVVAQIDRLIVVRRTLAATSTAIAVEPTNPSPAQILLADLSWNSSQVDQYLNLFGTREGRAVLMPATSQRIECERQVAALDSLRLMLQSQPSIGENLTEYRLAGMREHAVELGACDGVVAQIDRITTVRRTLAATVTAVAPAPEECTDSNWRWDNPVCNSPSSANKAIGSHIAFVSRTATQCQISTVWRLSRSQGWDPGVFMARHYLDMRFDGRVLDESVCGPTPVVAQRPAPAQPAAPPPPPVPPTPDEIAEDLSDESWSYQADELRPGHPLYDVEMRADCSVYYRGVFVQPASADEGSDGQCSVLPTISRSPSGRRIAIHSRLSDYGNEQISVIDTVNQSIAVGPRELFSSPTGIFPLNVWSEDENDVFMFLVSNMESYIYGFTQFSIERPCEFNIASASLYCVDENRFRDALQDAAIRASPRARCLTSRTCFMAMDISEARFEAGEFAYTGTVQLKGPGSEPTISETFVPGEDIVWFQFSGRGPRSTAQDITLRVLDPSVRIMRP